MNKDLIWGCKVMSAKDEDFKIGLALGGGGARGLAHIGVIEVLEREDVNIDMIAGTSIGSVIGGLYASGVPLKYIKGIADVLEWDNITDITFPRIGLIKGNKFLSFMKVITGHKNFSELDIPFAAVCCDIESGEKVTIDSGSIARAIRGSISIPGIYVPFNHQDRLLVDGGIIDKIPVSTVRDLGADVIIAVDVGADTIRSGVNNIFDVLFNTFDIMHRQFKSLHKLNSDIIIKPCLEEISSFDLENVEKCIDAGRKAAEESIASIKKIIEERKT